ncbi:hypothetical protein [Dickeya phage Amaethon]|nr:hypothetical protein [Dickeya phage Amaethon]
MAGEKQTIAQVPYDVTDPTSVTRFMGTLVENLDKVLGFKGDKEYLTSQSLESEGINLSSLASQLATIRQGLTKVQSDVDTVEDSLSDMQATTDALEFVVTTRQLDEAYRDFNNTSWSILKGKGEFTATGLQISNSPVSIPSSADVTVLVDSTGTNSSVWQTIFLIVNDSGTFTRTVWSRYGVNSDWIQLS